MHLYVMMMCSILRFNNTMKTVAYLGTLWRKIHQVLKSIPVMEGYSILCLISLMCLLCIRRIKLL